MNDQQDQADGDHFGDMRALVEDDLAAFVRDADLGRSLTVVRELNDPDAIGQAQRFVAQLRAASADQDMCPPMQRAVARWDGGRPQLPSAMIAVVRLDDQGHRGLAAAVDHLWQLRGKDERDFWRVVEFARRVVATDPTPDEDKRCCDSPAGAGRLLRAAADRSGGTETAEDEAAEPAAGLARFLLPDDLWDRTDLLKHFYQAAMHRLVCPDALLYSALVRLASLLHHGSQVETGKGPSPLSTYFAPIADSGGGKDESMKAARQLLAPFTKDRFAIHGAGGYFDGHLGSGEGLVDVFLGDVRQEAKDPATGEPVLDKNGDPKVETVTGQVRNNALFSDGEGRRVFALAGRRGAVLWERLCDLFSGNGVGEANTKAGGRSRHLDPGSYVVGVILGFQLDYAEQLFEDAAGGGPQRFTFAPAQYAPFGDGLDDDVEFAEVLDPGPLDLAVSVEPIRVLLTPEQRKEVLRAFRARQAGRPLPGVPNGPLDAHRMLIRCRLAALLAILHGDGSTAIEVAPELWDIAGVMVNRSCALRDWLAGRAGRRAAQLRELAMADQVEVQANAAERIQYSRDVREVADQIAAALPQTISHLRTDVVTGSRRHLTEQAVQLLVERGIAATAPGRRKDSIVVSLVASSEDDE